MSFRWVVTISQEPLLQLISVLWCNACWLMWIPSMEGDAQIAILPGSSVFGGWNHLSPLNCPWSSPSSQQSQFCLMCPQSVCDVLVGNLYSQKGWSHCCNYDDVNLNEITSLIRLPVIIITSAITAFAFEASRNLYCCWAVLEGAENCEPTEEVMVVVYAMFRLADNGNALCGQKQEEICT